MIEDEANIAEALRFILSRAGWQVALHPEGSQALHQIRQHKPRLVILDLMLPGRSGSEILLDLRADADSALAQTPVLMLTARAPNAELMPVLDQATAVLTKPFANDDLRRVVRELLT